MLKQIDQDRGQCDSASAKFTPTDAPCGSRAKVEVIRKRAELGVPLFHPDDSTQWMMKEQQRAKQFVKVGDTTAADNPACITPAQSISESSLQKLVTPGISV